MTEPAPPPLVAEMEALADRLAPAGRVAKPLHQEAANMLWEAAEAHKALHAASVAFLLAFRILRAHPDNDSTKRFDRKLMRQEIAEDHLATLLGDLPEDDEENDA